MLFEYIVYVGIAYNASLNRGTKVDISFLDIYCILLCQRFYKSVESFFYSYGCFRLSADLVFACNTAVVDDSKKNKLQ